MTAGRATDAPTRAQVLKAADIGFGYRDHVVLEGVSFEIPAGEIWGLVGRSGIGKTTLLNIVLGLYRPSTGNVSMGNVRISRPGRIKGAVFRDTTLIPWLDVLQNVLFPDNRAPEPERVDRALALLREAGLGPSLDLLPKQLSAGMAKRVELIRALLLDEQYFVADEPFSALDVTTRREQHQIWQRLNRTNRRTGILCTHDPAEAAALCDGVLVLHGSAGRGATVDILRLPPAAERDIQAISGLGDPLVRSIVERMG